MCSLVLAVCGKAAWALAMITEERAFWIVSCMAVQAALPNRVRKDACKCHLDSWKELKRSFPAELLKFRTFTMACGQLAYNGDKVEGSWFTAKEKLMFAPPPEVEAEDAEAQPLLAEYRAELSVAETRSDRARNAHA